MSVKPNSQLRSLRQVFIQVCFSILYAPNFYLILSAKMSNLCPVWYIKDTGINKAWFLIIEVNIFLITCLFMHLLFFYMLAFYRSW